MKIYGYIRVSSEKQEDKDGPKRQRENILAFCKANGFDYVRSYTDVISGTTECLSREGFFKMLQDAKEEGVMAVVAENADRLARDLISAELLFCECRTRGIAVYVSDRAKEDLTQADTDPTKKLIRQILGAIAEFAKSQAVMRLRAGRERKKADGELVEGNRPYGYYDEEKAILRVILNLHWAKNGCTFIAQALNESGFRRRNGKSWNYSAVLNVLTQRRCKIRKPNNVRLGDAPWQRKEAMRQE
jgi:DNA invertase Pin-like site-specific DNA recombinase